MKIAFASCSNIKMQNDNQPIWGIIHGQKPDLLLLLGDNVYMDEGVFNAENLENRYKRQLAEPHFNKLLCEVPYLAIWDNHDFGTNDLFSDSLTEEQKKKSRELFDRYLKNRSVKPHTPNVYCTHTIGSVKIIMLDTRSYQLSPYNDDNATLLGSTQQEWLLNEMRLSTGITIICSGMTYSFGDMCWKTHKNWFDRFTRAVTKTSKPLFLGGNIHTNEFKQHIFPDSPLVIQSVTGDPVSSAVAGETYLYEAISSSVGRNMKNHLPHNKYGIVDIGATNMEITLYSQKPGKFFHKVVNINNWKLEE